MTDRELVIPITTFLFGLFLGWIYAHNTVANECGKLGSFYVGDKVYECKLKGDNNAN